LLRQPSQHVLGQRRPGFLVGGLKRLLGGLHGHGWLWLSSATPIPHRGWLPLAEAAELIELGQHADIDPLWVLPQDL
jgi:hypothetical protein